MSSNPFEAPASAFEVVPPSLLDTRGVWRSGKLLVFQKGAALPDACVKCNGPATHPLHRKLYWHHPAAYAALLFNVIIYVIVAAIVRKKADVTIPLCEQHRTQHTNGKITAGVSLVVGIVGSIVAGVNDVPVLIPIVLVAMLVGLIVGLVRANLLSPTKIDDTHVQARGACEAYLAPLPTWPHR